MAVGLPPAMPQASLTGASPGLRHGWYFQMSCGLPSVALRLADQYFLCSVGLKGSVRVALQWSQFAIRCPCPSQLSRPGVQPWGNQKTDCPGWHASVPLVHFTLSGSSTPVLVEPLPQLKPGSVESMALRETGVSIAPCAWTPVAAPSRRAAVRGAGIFRTRRGVAAGGAVGGV